MYDLVIYVEPSYTCDVLLFRNEYNKKPQRTPVLKQKRDLLLLCKLLLGFANKIEHAFSFAEVELRR